MSDSQSRILAHALPLVPFDGWSDYTLAQAAKAAGLEERELKQAFPAGGVDAIAFFFASEDEALAALYPPETLLRMRVPERIETLLLARLRHMALHKEAVRRAVAVYALPWNLLYSTRALYRTVDCIWRISGDNATDFNFYTKRATLAGVYGATLLYWLNDSSVDAEETALFLARRLAEVGAFGQWKKRLKEQWKQTV